MIECTKCLKWYVWVWMSPIESYRHVQWVCIPCKDLQETLQKTICQPLLSPYLSLILIIVAHFSFGDFACSEYCTALLVSSRFRHIPLQADQIWQGGTTYGSRGWSGGTSFGSHKWSRTICGCHNWSPRTNEGQDQLLPDRTQPSQSIFSHQRGTVQTHHSSTLRPQGPNQNLRRCIFVWSGSRSLPQNGDQWLFASRSMSDTEKRYPQIE